MSNIPSYLTVLVPNDVGNTTSYNLRNADNISETFYVTRVFSFLPQTISDCNLLTL